MTLNEALALAQTLAPKSPGNLITAADWNALVSVVVEYGNGLVGLPERVSAAEAAIDALGARVDALESLPDRVQALEDQTAPLRANYRLTVNTASENVLVGEVAEIVFKATALDGSPLAAPMPWLDVVATWGRLRASPGFTALDNAEENALSIQFNAAGEARVQLRSQFTKGFSPATESTFSSAMQVQVTTAAGTKTARQILAASASPQDPDTRLAFKAMHLSYDANKSVRGYADSYVGQLTGNAFVPGKLGGLFNFGEWQNYRATVMAFAKPDASPTTPDPTRGVATVQVNFREWIAIWSLDYVNTLEPVLPQWSTLLGTNLARPDVLPFAVAELDKRAATDGALGHVRNLVAFDKAASVINPGNDSALAQSKALLQGAVQMQLATGGSDAQAAKSFALGGQATQQTGQTARAAQATAADAAGAKQAVLQLEGRVKATEQAGKEITASLKTIGDGVNKINVAEVADLGGRLNTIGLNIASLARKIPGG
ncbi:MAG: hypothetical protein U1F50_08155 [Rubrivivax sp.]